MRRLLIVLFAMAGACGKPAALTPPIYATLPAPDADAENGPGARLPADTHPLRYALSLELVPERDTYRGEVAIDVALDRPRESIWLHQKGIRAEAVRAVRPGAEPLNGRLERVSESGLSALRFDQPVGPGVLRLEIRFEADVGKHLYGIYRATAAGTPYLFTQFEPTSAREAFPCFDEPRFKTPFDVTLRVKNEHVAVANTRAIEERAVEGGMREVRFATTERLPTYLIAFAVGPFDVVEAPPIPENTLRPHPLPLRGIAPKARGAELAYALQQTPHLLAPLERYFGIAYPYDKLDLIAVPDFAAGAMENAGAITFRDSILLVGDEAGESQRRLLAYVNAHELAHQWFGNLVTMPWWDDIWLNEAFATWMGTRIVDEVYPAYKAQLGALASTHQAMRVDSQLGARPIRQPITRDEDIAGAFDAITYSKGGAVLGMFERYLGEEAFRAGLRLYMQRHRFGAATSADLVRALAEASGKPEVPAAFFSFLEQPGVPLLSAEVECGETSPALKLRQSRYLPLGAEAPQRTLWQVPACVRYETSEGAEEQCVMMSEAELRVPLEGSACPAWVMPNAGAQGYYRWAIGSSELRALLEALPSLTPAERVSLADNTFAAVRAGALDASTALRALSQLVGMPERQVLDAVLAAFASVEEDLLEAQDLPAYRTRLAALLRPIYRELGLLAPASEEDPERVLKRASVVRALALGARDPEVTAQLAALGRAILAGEATPQVAALSPELRDEALAVALREGGAPALERAIARLAETEDAQVRQRLLSAIGLLDDPALSDRVLGLSLDSVLRTNERLTPLFGQAAQRTTRERAYAWFKQNFDGLMNELGPRARSHALGVVGHFCSEERAADARAFFGPKAQAIAGGERALALALEAVDQCQAFARAQAESARAFFRTNASGARTLTR